MAHDDSVWDAQRRLWRLHRVFDAFDSEKAVPGRLGVLETADADDPPPEDLRRALTELQDTAVAEVVVDELADDEDAERFSQALLDAAKTSRQTALPAGWRPSSPSTPATWRWPRPTSSLVWRPIPRRLRWWNAAPGTRRIGAGPARR